MLTKLTSELVPVFKEACNHEHVFGSRMITALKGYGLEDPKALFWVQLQDDVPTAALQLSAGVLTIAACPVSEAAPIAQLIRQHPVHEIDTNWDQCAALQEILGGTTDSSYYMVYTGGIIEEAFPDIQPGAPETVFGILQRSHEYYRTHLSFPVWYADLKQRLDLGLAELYQLEVDGEYVGTGCIGSQDEESAALIAVAVVPEFRHRGLGTRMSRFLVKRIQEMGKTPRLISGYDAVAELYRQVGFEICGRWGELYI